MSGSRSDAAKLEEWLVERLPGLQPHLEAARQEQGVLQSEYAVLSLAVKPYVETLLAGEKHSELTHAWLVLEEIQKSGHPQAQNELGVTLEEMNLWRFVRYLGPEIRNHWFECITWYPMQRRRIDRLRYQARWREEITKIGGFEKLTDARELEIRYRLKQEFKIEGLRAPEPGGDEWRAFDLPWPLPPAGSDDAA